MKRLIAVALLLAPREFRVQYGAQIEATALTPSFADVVDIATAGIAAHLEAISREGHIAFRSLMRAPLLALAAIVTLALAISMTSSLYGVFEAVIAAPLPYAHANRLAFICDRPNTCGQTNAEVMDAVRFGATTLDDVAAFQWNGATILGHGLPQAADVAWSSWNIFRVLGVKPILGRFFTAADASYSVRRVVIRESLWRRLYGSDPAVVGKTIDLDGKGWTIIGVAPDSTYMPVTYGGVGTTRPRDLWMPIPSSAFRADALNNWTIARIRRGVPFTQVAADMQRIDRVLHRRHPLRDRGVTVRAVPFANWFFRSIRTFVAIAFVAVALVVVIACANVANLLLARTIARRSDIAIAYAVGGSFRQVVARLFAEASLLSAAAMLLGLPLAWVELALLRVNLAAELPRVESASIDTRVIVVTSLVTIAVAMVAAAVPAVALRGRTMFDATRSSRGPSGAAGRAVRSALVVVQVALAFVVLASSAVLVRSVVALASQPIGFEPAHIDLGALVLSSDKFFGPSGPAARRHFIARMQDDVRNVPGIVDAAFASNVPFGGFGFDGGTVRVSGVAYAPSGVPTARYTEVSPNYFALLHIPIMKGRALAATDLPTNAPVVVASERLARELFPGHAIGAHLFIDGQNGRPQIVTVVGVAGDVRSSYAYGADTALYFPVAQRPVNYGLLAVKVAGDHVAVARSVARAVAEADRAQAMGGFWALEDSVSAATAQQREMALVLGILGCVALALSLGGVFAVVVLNVESRRFEFAVRLAVGASSSDVLVLIMLGSLQLAFAGVALGCIVAAFALRGIQGLVFQVSAVDPMTLALAALFVVIAILVASALPAMRAARTNASTALRYQ